ncbi:MAG: efflux RND transporter periplasmic adaptor subunit [Vicinamibacteria bacterium]
MNVIMKRYLKNPRFIAAVLLVAGLLTVALWPTALAVEVGTLTRGPLRVTVEHEGKTRVHDRFVVSAPVAGRLERIELEPGDRARKGETLLATFRPADPGLLDARARSTAEARIASAQALAGRARAAAQGARTARDLARSEAARQRALAAQRLVSDQALESAASAAVAAQEAMNAADFDLRSAEQEMEVAKAQLVESRRAGSGRATLDIRSPIDGVVLTRTQQSEAVLQAGSPLLELGAPRDLEIVADFLSTDAVKVNPGDAVRIEQWGGEKALNGRVRRVEPSGFLKLSALGVEEQRVNVIISFEDAAEVWQRLGDGYRVEVSVVIWEQPDILKVPTGALFRHAGSWAVFIFDGGRARLREVGIGRRNELEAQVLSGLEAGARVIIHPGDGISDGTRVTMTPPS